MVVQMVACQVGKQPAGKLQSANAVLGDGVAGALHKGVFAAGLHHLVQQPVQLNGVGRGMVGRDGLVLDVVAYGREQSAAVAELTEHII